MESNTPSLNAPDPSIPASVGASDSSQPQEIETSGHSIPASVGASGSSQPQEIETPGPSGASPKGNIEKIPKPRGGLDATAGTVFGLLGLPKLRSRDPLINISREIYASYKLGDIYTNSSYNEIPEETRKEALAELERNLRAEYPRCEACEPWFANWLLASRHKSAGSRRRSRKNRQKELESTKLGDEE